MKKIFTFFIINFLIVFIMQDNSSGQLDDSISVRTLAIEELFNNRTDSEQKMESSLFYQLVNYKKSVVNGIAKSVAIMKMRERQTNDFDNQDRILLTIRLTTRNENEGIQVGVQIQGLSCHLLGSAKGYNGFIEIAAYVPVDLITEIAKNPSISLIKRPKPFFFRTVTSQGDLQLRANEIRARLNIDGSGIKVGLISDGADHRTDCQNMGELPAVDILRAGSGDEGTAMLEIIHDIAPGAELYFAGIRGLLLPPNWGAIANLVRDLHIVKGCKVIVDDFFHYEEPFFSDEGEFGTAIRNFINQGNVYVTAAGNSAEEVYSGTTSLINNYHIFPSGNNYLEVTVPDILIKGLYLQWKTRWLTPTSDFDLEVYDVANNVSYWSSYRQLNGATPFEEIEFPDPGTYRIRIFQHAGGSDGIEFKLFGFSIPINNSGTNHVFGHSAYPNVISVAAYSADDPANVAHYSSRGPATMYSTASNQWLSMDVPTITATSKVETYVGTIPGSGMEPFFEGTSAAAPHIAGIAALYFDALPHKTNVNFKEDLTLSAANIGNLNGGTYSHISGYGKADALECINLGMGRVATPIFSKNGGTFYTQTVEFSISCSTNGATITYTDDGTDPTANSTPYQFGTLITINQSKIIRARAFKSGMLDSYIQTQAYELPGGGPQNPPPPGQLHVWQKRPDYSRNVVQYNNSDYIVPGGSYYYVGSGDIIYGNATNEKARAFFQWNLPDNVIPDDAQIMSIELGISINDYGVNSPSFKLIATNTHISSGDIGGIWNSVNSGTVVASGIGVASDYILLNYTPASNSVFIDAIQNSLTSNKFQLAIVAENENSGYYFRLDSPIYPKLTIIFVPPEKSITVQNEILHLNVPDYNLGQISIDNEWKNSPFTKPTRWGTKHLLQATSDILTAFNSLWKFNKWSNNNSNLYVQSYPVITSSSAVTVIAKFMKIVTLNVFMQLEGVDYEILNQEIPEGTILNIPTAENTITSNNRIYYFIGWSDGTITREHPPISMNNSIILKALYKGIHVSSNEFAYSNNSQRKFVRTNNGYLHNVYESMNRVWYEMSTNNGNTWRIMNSGNALSVTASKNPSIAIIGDFSVAIAFQEEINGYYYIKVLNYNYILDTIWDIEFANDTWGTGVYNDDADPVISFTSKDFSRIIVIWKVKDDGPFQPGGLYYRYGYLTGGASSLENIVWKISPDIIPETNSNSSQIALDSRNNSHPLKFHLAWKQNREINYYCFDVDETAININNSQIVSLGSGFEDNYKPSVLALDNGTARICWIGERKGKDDEIQKSVVFTDPISAGRFWVFGRDVNSVGINKCNTRYTIAWAVDDYNTIRYTDSETLRRVSTLNIKGKYVQLSNGSEHITMRALAFNTTALPYYMQTAQVYSDQTPVIADEKREGIVSEEDAQVYFSVGDATVDNEQISFVEIPDTVTITSQQTANQYLVSEPFSLTDNSEFFYSVKYGLTDSLAALSMLSGNKSLTFKVELLDAVTNEILGVFDEVTYDRGNLIPYEKIDYQVLTNGIGERTVKLRLVINSNFSPDYSVAEKYDTESGLAKKQYKQINYQGSLAIKEYALEQNYPNPFNPTTTINYQIKEDGLVTLKIYDILGSEIKTLVNEEKTQGRYSHNFNASDLASGVYIYQLRVNDFVSSKKLLLLK